MSELKIHNPYQQPEEAYESFVYWCQMRGLDTQLNEKNSRFLKRTIHDRWMMWRESWCECKAREQFLSLNAKFLEERKQAQEQPAPEQKPQPTVDAYLSAHGRGETEESPDVWDDPNQLPAVVAGWPSTGYVSRSPWEVGYGQ